MTAPRVTAVDRMLVKVPFNPRTSSWTSLLTAAWGIVEIVRVETDDPDVVGWGETLLHYTWRQVSDESAARVIGRPVAELVFDDGLGAGLQMALADAVGKASEVPVYRLLGGQQVRDAVPISWWCAEAPPAVLAEEAAEAVAQGYLSFKLKARPWFDIVDQVKAISDVTPPDFRIDLDWNSSLLTADAALPVLQELDAHERVAMYESPIRRHDLNGQRFLRSKINRPLAEHYDPATFCSTIDMDGVDGFVAFGAGISGMLEQGLVMAAHHKPFWLQIVGTGLTTAMSAHLGAVLTHARWPSVSALNTFADDLLATPLEISEGFLTVPTEPGLGVVVDEAALQRLQVADGAAPTPPRRILTLNTPGRRPRNHTTMDGLWRDAEIDGRWGGRPVGAHLEVRDDDGSPDFDEAWVNASRLLAPHVVRGY